MRAKATEDSFFMRERGGLWMKDYKSGWWFHIHAYKIPEEKMELLEGKGFSLESLYALMNPVEKQQYWDGDEGVGNEFIRNLCHTVYDGKCEGCQNEMPSGLNELAELQRIGTMRKDL